MIVANHPSLIDVLFLLACVPEAVCIVKHALRRNPVLTWLIGWAGYVSNGSPDGLVRDCVAALAGGHSLIVFPEGTRSTPGCPLALRRGAARIALESGAPIVPVRIHCEPSTLTKGTRWYQIPPRPPHLSFVVGAPLQLTSGGDTPDSTAGRARALTQQLARLLAPGESDSWYIERHTRR
jgi:1-acyl-sn-glycerol-3-phosphate acyltransferase